MSRLEVVVMASWCDRGRNKRSALTERGLRWTNADGLTDASLPRHEPRSVSALTLARRDATDPAPRLEAPSLPASARASRQANVTRQADLRVGFVTWIVGAAVLIELAYKVVWP